MARAGLQGHKKRKNELLISSVNHTISRSCLYFTVAPQWVIEPEDVATLAGGILIVHCQAQGFPQPQITWMRGQGKRPTDKYCVTFAVLTTVLLKIQAFWDVIQLSLVNGCQSFEGT